MMQNILDNLECNRVEG